ncbi:MAG: hypothetical protein KatS3mg065_0619 [Chloroflexota bacterium]|nr:MAG: hypothetical protein KatS3mg065_0619 [Chloroflexota bacterium]
MRAAVEATRGFAPVLGGFGGFGAAVALPEGFAEPVLVAATDGVGTKTELARRLGRLETIGRDLVAMCADDVVCSGRPRSSSSTTSPSAASTPSGWRPSSAGSPTAAGRPAAPSSAARRPSTRASSSPTSSTSPASASGSSSGRRSSTARGSGPATPSSGSSRAASTRTATPSSGRSSPRAGSTWPSPYGDVLRRVLGPGRAEAALAADAEGRTGRAAATLGDVLLRPTPIYARRLLAVRERLRASGFDLGGVAHITGGGLPGNVPRILPRRPRGAPRPRPLAAALGHALARRRGRDRRAGAPGDGQRRPRPRRRRPADGVRGDHRRLRRRGLAARLVGVVVEAAELGGLATSKPPCRPRRRHGRRRRRVGGERSDRRRRLGAGSNLRALVAAARRGELGGEVVLVFADRPCPALDWAAGEGIATALVPGGDDAQPRRSPRGSPARTSSSSPATCGSSGRPSSPPTGTGS